MFIETLKLSLRTIMRNALRSFLTVLGIVIGVAAVIAMVALGQGTTAQVTSSVAKLGSNLLMVRAARGGPGPDVAGATPKSFSLRDVEAISTQVQGVRVVAPAASTQMTAVYGNLNHAMSVTGTDNRFFDARDWPVVEGREFTDAELQSGTASCILGNTTKTTLFGDSDPLGATIRLKQVSCKVIGVLEAKGASGFGTDQDDIVIMPLEDGPAPRHRQYRCAADLCRRRRRLHDRRRHQRHRGAAARAAPYRRRRARRFQRLRHGPDRQRADRHHRRAHRPAGGGRRRQPAGRRHRHHEHHAGLGDRAHARDRHPSGHRRRGRPGADAVPGRGGGAVAVRRPRRHPRRLRPVGGRRRTSSTCRWSSTRRSSPSPSCSRPRSASSSAISRPAAPPASIRSRRSGTNRARGPTFEGCRGSHLG